jgi:hypothetical protein
MCEKTPITTEDVGKKIKGFGLNGMIFLKSI